MTTNHRKVLRVLVDLLYEVGEGTIGFDEISSRTGIAAAELFSESAEGATTGICVDLEKWGAASTSHHGSYVPRDFAMIAENWSREPMKSDPSIEAARKQQAAADLSAVNQRVAEVLGEVIEGKALIEPAIQRLRDAGLLVESLPTG